MATETAMETETYLLVVYFIDVPSQVKSLRKLIPALFTFIGRSFDHESISDFLLYVVVL